MKLVCLLVGLVCAVVALRIKEPTLTVNKATYARIDYACSCTDDITGTIYLFNKANETEQQWSSQVTVTPKTLATKVTIADMGLFKFDQFVATACVTNKNTREHAMYVIGHKLSDGANQNKTNVIVKWNLETYELLQYNQLDSSLDNQYFHAMTIDREMRLLFAISSSMLQQLDMNCLDILDNIQAFPGMDATSNLDTVAVNTVAKRVFVSMSHQSRTTAHGALYAISYQQETLSKQVDSTSMQYDEQVGAFTVDSASNTLYAAVHNDSDFSIVTFTADGQAPKLVQIFPMEPMVDGVAVALAYQQQTKMLYTAAMVVSKSNGIHFAFCEYAVPEATKLARKECTPLNGLIGFGSNLLFTQERNGLLYPYIGEGNPIEYRLATIEI